jgi:hypothetical protein
MMANSMERLEFVTNYLMKGDNITYSHYKYNLEALHCIAIFKLKMMTIFYNYHCKFLLVVALLQYYHLKNEICDDF